MPFILPKPRKGTTWLSSQVQEGMDTSDPDPANWHPFGQSSERDKDAAAAQPQTAKTAKPAQTS